MTGEHAVVVRETRRGDVQARAAATRCVALPPDLAPDVTLAVVEASDAATVRVTYRRAGGGVAEVTARPGPLGAVAPGTAVLVEPDGPWPAAPLAVWERVEVVADGGRRG